MKWKTVAPLLLSRTSAILSGRKRLLPISWDSSIAELLDRVERLGLDRLDSLEALDASLAETEIGVIDVTNVLAAARDLGAAGGRTALEASAILLDLTRTVLGALPEELETNERWATLQALTAGAAKVGRLEERARVLEQEIEALEARHADAGTRVVREESALRDLDVERKVAEQELADARSRACR